MAVISIVIVSQSNRVWIFVCIYNINFDRFYKSMSLVLDAAKGNESYKDILTTFFSM